MAIKIHLICAYVLVFASGDLLHAQGAGTRLSQSDTELARLSEDQIVLHVLNRAAFGAQPGQAEAVKQIGWREWIRQQLRPAKIDDAQVESYVAQRWPTLVMTLGQLMQQDYMKREQVRQHLPPSVVYRAVHSDRQLQEVIVTFWRNHFSVDQNKDSVGFYTGDYETMLRRYAFGRFDRLLLATAQHPAMLTFLDNDVSQKPLTDSQQRLIERYESRDRKPRSVRALARHRGLNENYARELMELHTLGVDNYYTQQDVVGLARALTGWTVGRGDGTPFGQAGDEFGFYFHQDVHDRNAKVVVGKRLSAGKGVEEGIRIVRQLAAHPGTARFISYKLCRYLVCDEPSPKLVRRVARVFRRTKGNLPKVYEAILLSDDFLQPQHYRVKFKTPFEFVVSALRTTGAEITDYAAILHSLRLMGYDIYGCMDPTGYYDQAEAWLDPGVLVYRWDFAVRLGEGMIRGVQIPDTFMDPLNNLSPKRLQVVLLDWLLPGGVSTQTHALLGRELAKAYSERQAVGLVVGSPVFQQQ